MTRTTQSTRVLYELSADRPVTHITHIVRIDKRIQILFVCVVVEAVHRSHLISQLIQKIMQNKTAEKQQIRQLKDSVCWGINWQT